jgi:type II secretory pathway pseudopilin PulG
MRIQPASRRSAFTLVEMLVASALVIFMMYIIASAFEKGLESFRVLRVQGDLQDKLRAASSILRLDLTAPHFDDSTNTPNQNDFLSAQRLNDQMWQPPVRGYFRISQPGTQAGIAGWPAEGVDPDNTNTLYYGMDTVGYKDLYLQFTVNMSNGHPGSRGARGRRDQFAQTDTWGGGSPAPGMGVDGALNQWSTPDYNVNDTSAHPTFGYSTLFTSYWTEVTYFLRPQTDVVGNVIRAGGPNGPPIFNLFRRHALLVDGAPQNANMQSQSRSVWNASEVSVAPYYFPPNANDANPPPGQPQSRYNRPSDVTEPRRRWGMDGSAFGIPYFKGTPGFNTPLFPSSFPTYLDDARTAASNYPPLQNTPPLLRPYLHPIFGPRIGGDLILTDLVDFEVKVYWEPVRYGAPNTSRFINPTPPPGSPIPQARAAYDAVEPSPTGNPDFPFDRLPLGINGGLNSGTPPPGTYTPRIFDTWTANTDIVSVGNNTQTYQYGPGDPNTGKWNDGHFMPPGGNPTQATMMSIPLRVRVRAIQIKMRIWDKKSSLARQVTLIQDL